MKQNSIHKYVVFWATQSFSQLGSAMTGFALIIWAYGQTKSAMSVALMSLCSYLPYVLVSIFAGTFIDSHSKKAIMLAADALAAACSLCVLGLCISGRLLQVHIYVVNAVVGLMNAFQSPAEAVAIGMIVPKERLKQASGMASFSANLITVVSPMAATALLSFAGLEAVIFFDLLTFFVAFFVLLLAIRIPESVFDKKEEGVFAGFAEGVCFLKENKGIWYIILTMCVINFFSRLTYENILSPMVLARSGGDSMSLGFVNAAIGIAGIAGGLLVTVGKKKHDSMRMIYFSAALSFLFGDLLMGLGRNTLTWCMAGIFASLPIPFVCAGQNIILYHVVSQEMQGRIFAVRNAIQFGSIPFGILLGGALADYCFEPFMAGNSFLAGWLHRLVGEGAGSGMAVMFLCTGILGSICSILAYHLPAMKELKGKYR